MSEQQTQGYTTADAQAERRLAAHPGKIRRRLAHTTGIACKGLAEGLVRINFAPSLRLRFEYPFAQLALPSP